MDLGFCHVLVEQHWTCYLFSLSLSVLICTMGILLVIYLKVVFLSLKEILHIKNLLTWSSIMAEKPSCNIIHIHQKKKSWIKNFLRLLFLNV